MPQFQIPSSVVQNVGLFPAATTAATAATTAGAAAAPVLAEAGASALGGGLGGLLSFNPAAIAFGLALAKILGNRSGLQATPMTPEEAAMFAGQQRLDTALGGVGEGAGEFLLDAIEQAKAAGVTPEQIAETLNTRGDIVSELIGLTVGNNQPFVGVSSASPAAQGGAEDVVDVNENTTASTITGGLGDGSLGDAADLGTVSPDTVNDVNEEWTYDKDTDSFISSTRGDRIPNRGNADLRDGAVYTVTPVIGTDGVEAEHVVDTETKESVGIFNIDINTGLPSIIKSVDTGSTVDTGGLDNGGIGDTGIGDTGVGDGGVGSGDDFNTARDTSNIGKVLTVGSTPSTGTSTVTKGADGKDGTDGQDGQDGRDGRDGKDGKDGKDGMIGLFSSIQNTPITESILFTPKFTKLENVQQGMFDEFLRAAGGNR